MERILVGMSGGVDSAVAAFLLKQQGFEVVGAYMKNWINEDEVIGECPWREDLEDARKTAEVLGIEFRVVNLMTDYRRRIVDYLLEGYRNGLTPNPDVMCNREIKFGVFLDYARNEGFSAVATGHYALRCESTAEGRTVFSLHEGADKNKDQSYFLALLRQEQLAAARFPLGALTKPEVRRIATEAALPVATKKDSQGICFIGNVKMQDFLRAYLEDRPGEIVRATDGHSLGTHRGLHYYTLGQRKGIGIPSNSDNNAYVVVGKDYATNQLRVAFDGPHAPGLYTASIRVHNLSWIGAPITTACELEGRVRYRDPRVALRFTPVDGATADIHFATPQRGLASGQILALHSAETCLGAAIYS